IPTAMPGYTAKSSSSRSSRFSPDTMSQVLLIDDDQELCELLASWLRQEGFEVRACHDGQSARAELAQSAPAAVVLDVMLPDGSGLELLKQLRCRHAELRVLMLSARGEPLDRILGLE